MAKANGQNSSKSMPIQATVCEIITESYDYFMNDTDRIMLELVCEKLMEDLDAIFKRMRFNQKWSSYLDSYEPKKELLKKLIYSNEQNSHIQLNQIENQIVTVLQKL